MTKRERKTPKVSDKCANCNGPRIIEHVNVTDDDHPFRSNELKGRKREDAAAILAAREADPFCSTVCAREYYGVPLPPGAPAGRPRGVATKHGTEYSYIKGCRCGECKDAARVARKQRRSRSAKATPQRRLT